jgi:hypothetical protein
MAGTSTGSRKWRTSDWEALLRDALTLLDTLDRDVTWSFGGGTALAIHYGHRVSYDVDLFLSNADAITALSPNQNPKTKALLGGRKYEFPGNYLKLKLDQGEIDFILGGKRTSAPTQDWKFAERTIRIETPWEIAIKKLFYRPSTFKLRDIFDLAAVIAKDGDRLDEFAPIIADRLDKAADRVSALIPIYEDRVRDDVNATKTGQRFATKAAAESVQATLMQWIEEIR